jgi:hypothetical protein
MGLLGSLTSLQMSVGFTGTLPTTIGQLASLRYVSLEAMRVVGTIPSEFERMTSLLSVRFYNVTVGGTIPSALFRLSKLSSLSLLLFGKKNEHANGQ